jgi:transposase
MANQLSMAKIDTIATLHRRHWSIRRIAKELGIHRATVARHIQLLEQAAESSKLGQAPIGAVEGKLGQAPIGENPPKIGQAPIGFLRGPHSLCEPWRQVILDKLEAGLTAQRIYQDLVCEHGFTGKYHSVRRFVWRLGRIRPLPFRRMECAPGEEVQVDFGTGAPVVSADGKKRRPHVLRMVLSHSRRGYSEAVWRQTTDTFIATLENGFHYFGGAPRVIVLDNLKAGVESADWYDPDVNPKLRSFAEHYGVALMPCKPRMPRHKGKIESGVGYVKGNALKGRVFSSLEEENRFLLDWERTIADVRIHGTMRQQVAKVFADVERPALLPLPPARFALFHESKRIVHRDGHVEVARAYYSVPPEYLGRHVWVRWDGHLVRVFNLQFEQIAVHVQREAGRFSTQQAHIAAEKFSRVERGAEWLLGQTRRIGSQAARWSEAVIQTRGIEGVRVLQGLLHLTTRHEKGLIDRACGIALSHGCYRLKTIRTLIGREAPRQESFAFVEEHPLIRDLGAYGHGLHHAFHKESRPLTPVMVHDDANS